MRLRDCQSDPKPLASPLIVTGRFIHACTRRVRYGLGQCLLLLALLWGGPATLAQSTNNSPTNTMGLGLTAAPSPVTLLQTLTYTVSVTNFYPAVLTGATVTNLLPTGLGALNITATTNSLNGFSTNGSTVIFFFAPLTNLQIVDLTVTVQPTTLGTLTNITAVGQTLIFFGTNPPPVTNITSVASGHVNLRTSLSGPTSGVLVNDRLQYQVTVTNFGPDAATGVVLTNLLPAGLSLLGISPATAGATVDGQSVTVPLGTLAVGAGQKFTLDVQPTNAGFLTLTNLAGAATGFLEDNPVDNISILYLFAGVPLESQLSVTNLSVGQQFNPQTGLMEQMVRLTNVGTNDVPNARLVISGLTNRLVNAGGTNGNDPFIVLGTALGAGQSVDLLLELFVPGRVPVADPVITPLGVVASTPLLPTGTGPVTARFTRLPSERVLVEFPSVPGHRYAVIYGDSATNTILTLPPIIAPADVTQWFDYGPPRTAIPPRDAPVRLYRVVELP